MQILTSKRKKNQKGVTVFPIDSMMPTDDARLIIFVLLVQGCDDVDGCDNDNDGRIIKLAIVTRGVLRTAQIFPPIPAIFIIFHLDLYFP